MTTHDLLTVSPVPSTITSYSSFIFLIVQSSAVGNLEARKWRFVEVEMKRGCGAASGGEGRASQLSITDSTV